MSTECVSVTSHPAAQALLPWILIVIRGSTAGFLGLNGLRASIGIMLGCANGAIGAAAWGLGSLCLLLVLVLVEIGISVTSAVWQVISPPWP